MFLKYTLSRVSKRLSMTLLLVVAVMAFGSSVQAQVGPPGFLPPEIIANGLNNPTAMQFAPDGRLFVAQQGGALRVIDATGTLLPTPFVTLTTTIDGERGLLGIAFDPNFASNGFVYLYYTVPTAPIHNRVSRFTADPGNPNVALAGSELVLMDLDPVGTVTDHNGGAMHFGPDGKLYVAVGDNKGGPGQLNGQDLNTTHGKILRINPDGSIPTDNPFYGTLTGNNRAIYAYGFRNPFTFAFQPGTGRLFANDVGENQWEEINDIVAGGNYGWPYREADDFGLVTPEPAGFTYISPIHQYVNDGGATNCAITGGTFYNNQVYQYPASYLGDYFFGDFCGGFISSYDTATNTATSFFTGLGFGLVDLKTSPSGEVYYLSRNPFGGGVGAVLRIRYEGTPEIVQNPDSVTVSEGQSATFTCVGTGGQNLTYQWQRDGSNISGATGATYTTPPTTSADNGATFTCTVTNSPFGSVTSAPAVLSVSVPVAAAPQPNVGVFDPAISKIGFLIPGQVGVTGEQLEWVITVSNTGTATGFNIVVTDTLRTELRVDSVDLPRGTFDINGQTVTVTIPSLAPSESVQFSIFTTVLEGAQVDNTACVTASGMSGEECASSQAIRSLPATGETPWWRLWVIIGAFGSIALAIAGLGMLMVMDAAVRQPAEINETDL